MAVALSAAAFLMLAGQIGFAQSVSLPIHEINRKAPVSGDFVTVGYVAGIYACPPCPQGAMCKPCMRDNIVISEKKKNLNHSP